MGRTGGGLIVRVILGLLLPVDNSGFPMEKISQLFIHT